MIRRNFYIYIAAFSIIPACGRFKCVLVQHIRHALLPKHKVLWFRAIIQTMLYSIGYMLVRKIDDIHTCAFAEETKWSINS